MATLTISLGSIPVILGSTGSAIGIVIVVLIVLAAVAFAIYYSTNEEFKGKVSDAFGSSSEKAPKPVRNVIRLISTDDFNALMASIGTYLTGLGFVPQSQAPNLYVYQKQEHKKPSAIIALLLFFFCIIPMIIYLAKGGGVKTTLVTIQVRKTQDAYYFDIKAPAGVRRRIYGFLQPYLIPVETATQVSAPNQISKEAIPAQVTKKASPQLSPGESIESEPESESIPRNCSYCGEALGPTSTFCPSCGTRVPGAESS